MKSDDIESNNLIIPNVIDFNTQRFCFHCGDITDLKESSCIKCKKELYEIPPINIKDTILIQMATTALTDEDEVVRKEAVDALGDTGGRLVLGILSHILINDSSEIVRKEAADELGDIKSDYSMEILTKATNKDKSKAVRNKAANSIEKIINKSMKETEKILEQHENQKTIVVETPVKTKIEEESKAKIDQLPTHYYSPKTGIFTLIFYFFPMLIVTLIFYPSTILILLPGIIIITFIFTMFASSGIFYLNIICGVFGGVFVAPFLLNVDENFMLYMFNLLPSLSLAYLGAHFSEREVTSQVVRDAQNYVIKNKITKFDPIKWKSWVNATGYISNNYRNDTAGPELDFNIDRSDDWSKKNYTRTFMVKVQNRNLLRSGFEFNEEKCVLIYDPERFKSKPPKYPPNNFYLSPISSIACFFLYFGPMIILFMILDSVAKSTGEGFFTFSEVISWYLLFSVIFALLGLTGKKDAPYVAIAGCIFVAPVIIFIMTPGHENDMLTIFLYVFNIFLAYGVVILGGFIIFIEILYKMMRDLQRYMQEYKIEEFELESWPKWSQNRSSKKKISWARRLGFLVPEFKFEGTKIISNKNIP